MSTSDANNEHQSGIANVDSLSSDHKLKGASTDTKQDRAPEYNNTSNTRYLDNASEHGPSCPVCGTALCERTTVIAAGEVATSGRRLSFPLSGNSVVKFAVWVEPEAEPATITETSAVVSPEKQTARSSKDQYKDLIKGVMFGNFPDIEQLRLNVTPENKSIFLRSAVKFGRLDIVKFMVTDVAPDQATLYSALEWAVSKDKLEIFKFLVTNVTFKKEYLDSILTVAVRNSKRHFVEFLLDKVVFDQGELSSKLEMAVHPADGNLKIVERLLLVENADFSPRTIHLCLDKALKYDCPDIARLLVAQDILIEEELCIIVHSVSWIGKQDLFEFMLTKLTSGKRMNEVLHLAIINDYFEVARGLVSKGAMLDEKELSWDLFTALEYEKLDRAEFLLNLSDTHRPGALNRTLETAQKWGRTDTVEFLKKKGAVFS